MALLEERLLFNKKWSWVLHVLFWLFVYLDIILDFPYMEENWDVFLQSLAIDIVVVYFNLYYLFPKFFLKKRYIIYFVLSLLCVAVIWGSNTYLFDPYCDIPENELFPYYIQDFVYNAFILAAAIGMKLFKTLLRNRIKLDELRQLKHKTELSYLKNQVNPHFLFNALNGMYVMAQKKEDNLEDSILDLSDLMRYQLYEGQKPKVSIKEEVNFLKNYIKFEQMRRKDLEVNLAIDILDDHVTIAPLLLLTFLENAMKHSKTLDERRAQVDIRIKADKEQIKAEFTNSIGDYEASKNDPNKGIGLKNVKRRLELLYPESAALNIDETADHYSVSLLIQNP